MNGEFCTVTVLNLPPFAFNLSYFYLCGSHVGTDPQRFIADSTSSNLVGTETTVSVAWWWWWRVRNGLGDRSLVHHPAGRDTAN